MLDRYPFNLSCASVMFSGIIHISSPSSSKSLSQHSFGATINKILELEIPLRRLALRSGEASGLLGGTLLLLDRDDFLAGISKISTSDDLGNRRVRLG